MGTLYRLSSFCHNQSNLGSYGVPTMEWEQVKAVAERALEDGMLTQAEINEILNAIMADKIVSPEEYALAEKIDAMVRSGEITVIK